MIRYTFILLATLIVSLSQAQTFTTKSKKAISLFREADNYRVRGQYRQAESLFKQALEKDDEFAEAWYLLGLTYKMGFALDESISCFEKAIDLFDGRVPAELHFEVGQVYLYKGDYKNASYQMQAFLHRGARDRKDEATARKALIDSKYALANMDNSISISPKALGSTVNGFNMQYFPVLTADQRFLIYTKRGPSDDEDLVVSIKGTDGKWSQAFGISPNINSRWNEGTCTVTADASQLIFTSCQGREGQGSCDLFISRRVGNEWSAPENMGSTINSPYWDSQPSLSTDGRTLYFVSSRPGGMGGKDIWISKQGPDGNWTTPQNAGTGINTPRDEVSPFIHANNSTLYFGSNGFPGYGGFDIYHNEMIDISEFPKNLGHPVNNARDQLSLFITADGLKAYYSDESASGGGLDSKIFTFDIPEPLQVSRKSNYVYGIVSDEETKEPVHAKIELFNLTESEPVSIVHSDPISGNYLMVLTEGAEYALYINGEGYLFESLSFDYDSATHTEPVKQDIFLKKSTVGSAIVLNNLFFDVADYSLKAKSRTELQKVVSYLKENSTLNIEISGHTDNTGGKEYNNTLSRNRAKSVAEYLIENGISPNRVSYRGFGDSRPIVPNDTSTNRSKNRRIEMEITGG